MILRSLALLITLLLGVRAGQTGSSFKQLVLKETNEDKTCSKVSDKISFCKSQVDYETSCGSLNDEELQLVDFVAGGNYQNFITKPSRHAYNDMSCKTATRNFVCAAAFPRCGIRSCYAKANKIAVCQKQCLAQAVKCGTPVHRCINVNNLYPSEPHCTLVGEDVSLTCEQPRHLGFCNHVNYPVHTDPEEKIGKWIWLDNLARQHFTELVAGTDSDQCQTLKKHLVCAKTFLRCDKSQDIKPICRDLCFEIARACGFGSEMAAECRTSNLYTDHYDCTMYGTNGWHTFLVLFVAVVFTTAIGIGVWYARRYIKSQTSSIQYQILNSDDVADLDFELENVENPFAQRGQSIDRDVELEDVAA